MTAILTVSSSWTRWSFRPRNRFSTLHVVIGWAGDLTTRVPTGSESFVAARKMYDLNS